MLLTLKTDTADDRPLDGSLTMFDDITIRVYQQVAGASKKQERLPLRRAQLPGAGAANSNSSLIAEGSRSSQP